MAETFITVTDLCGRARTVPLAALEEDVRDVLGELMADRDGPWFVGLFEYRDATAAEIAAPAISNAINSALARTDWQLLAQQKQSLARVHSLAMTVEAVDSDNLLGLLAWLDAIQDAAEAEGYPVEFLAE